MQIVKKNPLPCNSQVAQEGEIRRYCLIKN